MFINYTAHTDAVMTEILSKSGTGREGDPEQWLVRTRKALVHEPEFDGDRPWTTHSFVVSGVMAIGYGWVVDVFPLNETTNTTGTFWQRVTTHEVISFGTIVSEKSITHDQAIKKLEVYLDNQDVETLISERSW